MHKKLVVFSLVSVFALLFGSFSVVCSFADADLVIASHHFSDQSSGGDWSLIRVHPALTGVATNYSAYYQIFEVENTGYLWSLTVSLKKAGDPSGSMYAFVVSNNSDSVGGVFYLLSGALDVSTLTTAYANYTFEFDEDLHVTDGDYDAFAAGFG